MRTNPLAALIATAALLFSATAGFAASSETRGQVRALKITVLSTMLADGSELGEWGFAALIEADGHRLLFDTGAKRDVVLRNAESLRIDLTTVPELILSHSHGDHLGGFLALRDAVRAKNPAALARTHVGDGIFYPRKAVGGVDTNPVNVARADYERGGGSFVVHAAPRQIYPGVWLTGCVPRKHPERNWSGSATMVTPAGVVEDNLPEDMSLVIDTAEGLVVVTGCGHAGVINTLEHARTAIRPARIHALIGGVHLFAAKEETLAWTEGKLREMGVDHLLGAHCTGLETVYRFRQSLGLDRARAVVSAVGSGFELGRGVNARTIAK